MDTFTSWTRRVLAFGMAFSIMGTLIYEVVRSGEFAEIAIGALILWGGLIAQRYFPSGEGT